MGTYYKIACPELKELIDPDIDGNGIKLAAISHPGAVFPRVAIFAMANRWADKLCRVVADDGQHEGDYYNFKDVTDEVLVKYNALYGTQHSTGAPWDD